MEQIQKAALAPGDPSAQDIRVAAQATARAVNLIIKEKLLSSAKLFTTPLIHIFFDI